MRAQGSGSARWDGCRAPPWVFPGLGPSFGPFVCLGHARPMEEKNGFCIGRS